MTPAPSPGRQNGVEHVKIPLNLPLQRFTFYFPLFQAFPVFLRERVFTAEAPRSQRSDYFLITKFLLCALSVSAV
jgi:hypothetical protein